MTNIDSQINDRMQMYSGNPQALQQRYAQTQELVDLLALQKMKNDRAAATSAVQGAMQTPSNTVKGQLEQEAMQGSRNDVLRSMAPGIQQQGQRMAQMQNRAAMGLSGQAAPNMARMAQGGIVGYQEGGFMGPPEPNLYQRIGQGLKNYGTNAQESMDILRAAKAGIGVPYENRSAVIQQVRDQIAAEKQNRDPNFIQRMGQKLMDTGLDVEESKAILRKFYDNIGKTYEQKASGMANGGIVGYQQGGGVKRFQEGLAVIGDDESRFGVTTDSGLTPDEAVAMDMQGPEAQQPKFGDELGGMIESGASDLIDYVKENPLEAASYGLMFVPGLNIVRGGIAAMRAAPAIVNAATKVGRAAQKLYTKPRMSGYGSMVQGPKGKFMSAKDAQAAGLRLNRQFSPQRAAGVAGLGLNLGSQLMGGEEGETELPQNEGIAAGMYDVRSGVPTAQQKLGSMVDRPSAVLRDNMDERGEEGGLDIDFRALREFLAGGAGQTSTAGALGAGARGLGAYQAAEQARTDKIQQAAAELQLKRDLAVNEARMLDRKLLADYQGKLDTAELKLVQDILEQLNDPFSATGEEYQAKAKVIREQFARQPIEMENAVRRLKRGFLEQGLTMVRQTLGGAPTTSAAITDMGLE